MGFHRATLIGYLADDGGLPCTCWFEWGTTVALGNTTVSQTGKVTGDTVTHTLLTLEAGTVYYFRFVASNAIGTTYGSILSFTTLSNNALSVVTLVATNIWEHGATLNGIINIDLGYPCTVFFQYGASSSLGMETGRLNGVSAGTAFSIDIVGLSSVSPGRPVFFRAVAINRFGTAFGNILTFATLFEEGPKIPMQTLFVPIIGG